MDRTLRYVALLSAILGGLSPFARLAAQEPEPPPASSERTAEGGSAETADAARAAPADAALPGVPETTAAEHPRTYLDFAVAGGWLMLPLVLLSVLWLTFLVERAVALRSGRVLPKGLVRDLARLRGARAGNDDDDDEDDGAAVQRVLAAHPSRAGHILEAALTRLDEPRDEIESAVNAVAQREVHGMRKYVGIFAVIASVAPLLGLLGTVTGMIQAFREVAIAGLGSGQALAPGIYKALVTTAAGLIIAIPALLTHHWFHSRIDNYVQAINNVIVELVEGRRRDRRAREPNALEVGEA